MALIDLSGMNTIKYDIRSSRTGSNIKIGIHDSGGTTTEHTANISSANTFETQTWDISAVSDANKNAIDSIVVTVVNADSANTFYIDNFIAPINADFTSTALELTSSVKTPTYRSDGTVRPQYLSLLLSLKNVVVGHSIIVDGAALTLALHVPSVKLDSTYTTTKQELTSTLKAPAIRGDANVSVLTQTLTSLLNDPTYRSDGSFTATVQELVATLNDPTTVWSSSVSPDALTLTTTLKDGTPFLVTRIIRKGYSFGVTEQVTHTKLNNIADTAIWEISNQVAGDMFYFDGDVWTRIAKGTAGQKLTMVDGVPTWA